MTSYKSLIARICLYSFFAEFVLIYPFYNLMFKDYGLDGMEIGIIALCWGLTRLVCDIPTGALADKYGRRKLFIIAQFFGLLCYIMWLTKPNFTTFLIGNILWGMQSSLIVGKMDAYVYDEIKERNKEDCYARIWGYVMASNNFAIVLCSLLVAYIGIDYIFLLEGSIASTIMAMMILFTLPNNKIVKITEKRPYLFFIRDNFRYLRRHSDLLAIVLFSAVIIATFIVFNEFTALILDSIFLTKKYIPYIIAIIATLRMISNIAAQNFQSIPFKNIVIILICAVALVLTAYIFYKKYFLIISMIIFFAAIPIFDVLASNVIQQLTPSNIRATVMSTRGFIVSILYGLFALCFGSLVQSNEYRISGISLSMLALLCSVIFLFFIINIKKQQNESISNR